MIVLFFQNKKIKSMRFLIASLALVFLPLNSSFAFFFEPVVRNHIQIVGSSTVYPFAATIAEEFGRTSGFKTPVVEANGTGGGFKLFCLGVGVDYPDFSNASRVISESEIKKCHENGVKGIGQIKIGYDGIVLANSVLGQKYSLTKKDIFLALAHMVPNEKGELVKNYYQKWNEIDKELPKVDIAIYGPPSSSGTRDAFVELVMEEPCMEMEEFVKKYPDEKLRRKNCHIIRSDGKFIEAGENDNLIVQKLKNDKDAIGIFGYNFLEENGDILQAAVIDKISPSFDNIASGAYSISRPLFIYYKKEHIKLISGMKEFIMEIVSKDTIGTDGYLLQKGLVPLSDLEYKKVRDGLMNDLYDHNY